ncbi:hypothetical protein D3H65_06300 [Paraflavitalea soli]|uniref:Uncharacterized protein n=1 Tax=Paraflavitalea soli TaxID=2315862 RepID=A0A3B7MPW9_9BACT|nr:hypothetical protein [Paraflavitalea soli]AXY73615.1 hypothetical protein D3H65_06300 [Paraflavitalea soli]
MPTYFIDYETLVLEVYHQKKANNELLPGLRILRPAKLKEACEWVCNDRFERNDEQTIRNFFGRSGNQKECLNAIQRCEIDKFRPIINFLNGDTSKTDEKNIELLAWLIDFKERPFDPNKIYSGTFSGDAGKVTAGEENQGAESSIPNTPPTLDNQEDVSVEPVNQGESGAPDEEKQPEGISEEVIPAESDKLKWQTRSTAIAVILLSIIGAGGYWWLNNRGTNGIGGCMYWTGDHYESVACSPRPDKALVVPLDTVMVKYFRKITVPDTITNRAKGRVWYSKINNKVEFYTSDGYHPIVTSHHLKPLSDHIIATYIYPGMTVN